MTQQEHEIFTELFSDILTHSGIQYSNTFGKEAYVVYNNAGIMFSITFNKLRDSYILGDSVLLKSKYKQYGLSADAVPNYKMIFETVAFAYKIQQFVLHTQKDFSTAYKDMLIESDIEYEKRGDFETYVVTNAGIPGYAIGYNPKTQQHGFKRYELMNTLYKVCNISPDKKPDYASLYKRVKDQYFAQTVAENIQHLYDF
jgi:hypothetical protein